MIFETWRLFSIEDLRNDTLHHLIGCNWAISGVSPKMDVCGTIDMTQTSKLASLAIKQWFSVCFLYNSPNSRGKREMERSCAMHSLVHVSVHRHSSSLIGRKINLGHTSHKGVNGEDNNR